MSSASLSVVSHLCVTDVYWGCLQETPLTLRGHVKQMHKTTTAIIAATFATRIYSLEAATARA